MKLQQLRKIIREELQKENLFGTSFEKENENIIKALDRWVRYSIKNGDSEEDVLSTIEQLTQKSVDSYFEYLL